MDPSATTFYYLLPNSVNHFFLLTFNSTTSTAIIALIIQFLPPPTDQIHESLDELVAYVNSFAKQQGYTVRKVSIKKDPAGKRRIIKAFLICTKYGQTKRYRKNRNTLSYQYNCSFKVSAVHKIHNGWELQIINGDYSGHGLIDPKGITVHRRNAITTAVIDIISHQLKNYNTPSQILDNFREESKLKN